MTDFRSADFDQLADLYRSFAPPKYRLDADLIRQNTVGSPLFDWGASCIQPGEGFVAIKRSASRLYTGPDSDIAHITLMAFREPEVGIDLMESVKGILLDRGIAKIAFGTDNRHFFPGCPVDFYSLRDFLIVQGFREGGESHDLERNLADYVNPYSPPKGDVLRALNQDDLPLLEKFFDREFPYRWKYDVMDKVAAENTPTTVYGLFQDGACEGFALIQQSNCKQPIGGAVWREDLGPNWGSLGPIGISAALRGKGSGQALLGRSLEHLRDQGTQQCIIDWTGLVEFYGKHGFKVNRTYRYMTLSLENDLIL